MNDEDRIKRLLDRTGPTGGTPSEDEWRGFSARAHRSLMARRALTVGTALALVAFGGLAAGALVRDDRAPAPNPGPADPGPTERDDRPGKDEPTEEATPTPNESPSDLEERSDVVEVWFQEPGPPKLMQNHEDIAPTQGIATKAMELLLAGPSIDLREGGIGTSIPEGTELLGLTIDQDAKVATVDLSGEFESGGGSTSMRMRIAQVVFTLTQFDTIRSVRFEIDGEPRESMGGEGVSLMEGTRDSYEEFAPQIIVDTPVMRQEISGGRIDIRGTANVFEATVTYELTDMDGRTIVEPDFTTATCGTGCRGDFNATIRYEVEEPTWVSVHVYESSAEDGSPLHSVVVSVKLLP